VAAVATIIVDTPSGGLLRIQSELSVTLT